MSNTITIVKTFSPNDLPKWAQGNPDIVALAKVDYAFRCSVHDAKTAQMKRLAARDAKRARSDNRND